MRINQQKEKRLDILSFSATFPEDYLPYTSSYHRKAPYLVWEDRKNQTHRKYNRRKWKCSDSRIPCRRCSKSSLCLACAITFGILLLAAVIAASVYLGWLTHIRNSSTVSLTGKLRITEGDQFSYKLLDTTSLEFREKSNKYETLLEKVYKESSLRNAVVKAKILEFQEGSLEVMFYMTLNDPSYNHTNGKNLSTTAKDILRNEVENEYSRILAPLKIELQSLYVLDEDDHVTYEIVQAPRIPDPTVQPESKPSIPSTTTRPSTTSTIPSTTVPQNVESHRMDDDIPLSSGPWRPLMPSDRSQPSVENTDKVIPNLFTTSSPKNTLPILYRDSQIRRGLRNHQNNTAAIVESRTESEQPSKNKTSSELRFVSGFSVVRNGEFNAPSSKVPIISTTTPFTVVQTSSTTERTPVISLGAGSVKALPEHEVGAPLLISDSHSPPKKPNPSLRRLTTPNKPNVGYNIPTAVVNEKTSIEIPVEASLDLKRPLGSGQGFVVAVDEALFPEIISVPASTTKKPDVTTRKPESSTELTVGASLFIRNSRAQNNKPARPNIPYRIRKPTTKSNYFSPSPTPTKKFTATTSAKPIHFPSPELTVNAPVNVRGSSKGQAYLTLPKPTGEPTKKNETVVASLNTTAEVKLTKGANTTEPSSPGGVPKIISQYNPYNKDDGNKDSQTDDDGLSLRDKYEILSISKPFFHRKPENFTRFPTLKPDFTTSITLEEISFTGTTNNIQDTTKPPIIVKPTRKPITVDVSLTKIPDPEDFDLQSIAGSPVKKCNEKEEFTCVSTKTCIAKSKVCNRQKDCPDVSDETNCSCADYLKTRIFRTKICDGVVDCWDYSDENNCSWCSPDQFICPGAKLCVPQSKVCNGMPDCPGAEDESHCVKLINELSDTDHVKYRQEGHLVLRKNGIWRKLCVSNFPITSEEVTEGSWTVEELGKAVCNALSFRGLVSVKEERDPFGASKLEYLKFQSQQSAPGLSVHSLKATDCPEESLLKVACNSLECGLRPLSLGFRRRIVGGQSSLFGSWPWQVALYKEGEFQCGAVIVKEQWIMSAGHCFYHSKESHWTARMGLLRRGSEIPSPYEQIVNITHIYMHPDYIDRGFINDIVLLRLEKPLQFSDHIRPICLPQITEDMRAWDGQMCTAIGWGKLFEVGRIFPDTLQEVQLPIISTEECRKRTSFLPLYKITDNMFCAGYERGGRDACLGDSGGPLMCQRSNGRWSLVGVTSNGDGCGRPGRPGVYTKVVNYLEWIYSVIEKQDKSTVAISATCEGHRCPLGKCLAKKKVCDGVMDCWNGSDERHC